jgi:hypothetical protein
MSNPESWIPQVWIKTPNSPLYEGDGDDALREAVDLELEREVWKLVAPFSGAQIRTRRQVKKLRAAKARKRKLTKQSRRKNR